MKLVQLLLGILLTGQSLAQVKLQIRLDSSIQQPISGRLFIYTLSDTTKNIPNQPNPNEPMFAFNISNWKGTQTIELNTKADHMPTDLVALKPGYYKVAGILDTDPTERGNFNPGNVYARKDAILYVNEKGEGQTEVLFASVIPKRIFRQTDSVKEVSIKSNLLSAFRKKDIFLQSAVRLPASYAKDPTRKYPLVLVIPGWGGTHYDLQGSFPMKRYAMNVGKEKIFVYLNPENQSPFGLHAFVDSRVNGPWGKALVEELIPHLEEQFRIDKDPSQHFVMGQSTGGYGSLWLQLNYPDAFGGCWSVSPDPVDFSSFVGVNIYEKNVNFYTDNKGEERPFFMVNGKPTSTARISANLESFLGDGEQQQAFEAEFGIPDAKGRPQEIFDRVTGKVNEAVVTTWKPYDLGLFIQKNWKRLESKLNNKVHVYAGSEDNFFLNQAVEAFGKKAASVKATAVVEIIPKADHWSIWSTAFAERVQREIDERIR